MAVAELQRPVTTRRGAWAAVLATICWGLGSVLVKPVTAPPMALGFVRIWAGAGLALVLLYASGGRMKVATLRRSLVAGMLFGVHILVNFTALTMTSVANVTVIGALQPALVLVVAGRLFGDRARLVDWLWTTTGVAGVALVVLGGAHHGHTSALGDVLAAGNLCIWTVYFLMSKRIRDDLGTLEYVSAMLLAAAVVATPVVLAAGVPVSEVDGRDWLFVAGIVLVPGTAGHLLMNWAHRYVDVNTSSLITLGTPVVACAAAAVVLHEGLTSVQLAGGAAVLLAVSSILRRSATTFDVLPSEPAAEV